MFKIIYMNFFECIDIFSRARFSNSDNQWVFRILGEKTMKSQALE